MKNNDIIGIIFDMDGLMVDSEPIQLKAINDSLLPLGLHVAEPEFLDMVGRKAIENFRTLKQQHGFSESAEAVEQRKNLAYLQRIQSELQPMPGLYQAIALCQQENLITAIASSSPRKDILAVLDILGLRETFGVIASGDLVKRGKPAPDIFLKAAQLLAHPPTSFLVLEDTAHGVNAAKAAGMYCFAVPNRFTRQQNFSRADLVLNSLEELTIHLIRALPGSFSNQ